VRECQPDLLILDISIPKLDGLEVLTRFHGMNVPYKILVLTAQAPALFAIRCMQSGAAGFVCKQEALSELISAVRAVFSGYNYFPSQALIPSRENEGQLEVLQLFAQGRSNKEIATGMFLSNKTVSTYKKRLMQKLQANSLVELIEMAKRNALV
jgi:two-component system response regulator EvgA